MVSRYLVGDELIYVGPDLRLGRNCTIKTYTCGTIVNIRNEYKRELDLDYDPPGQIQVPCIRYYIQFTNHFTGLQEAFLLETVENRDLWKLLTPAAKTLYGV